MKFKRILSAVAALALSVTAIANMTVFAGSYGTPAFTTSVDYPVDMDGDTYLTVTVGYTGFEGFSSYSALKKAGVGITSAGVTLGYDETALEYIATMDGSSFSEGTAGGTIPSMQYAWADANMKNVPTNEDFMVAYFMVKDGVDFDAQAIEFTIDSYEIAVGKAVKGEATEYEYYGTTALCTEKLANDGAFTYGATATATPEVTATPVVTEEPTATPVVTEEPTATPNPAAATVSAVQNSDADDLNGAGYDWAVAIYKTFAADELVGSQVKWNLNTGVAKTVEYNVADVDGSVVLGIVIAADAEGALDAITSATARVIAE